MKLKYITIHNYRGIDKLDKLEVSNLNTFVGKNDTGKSIILRALECFFDTKKFSLKDIFRGKPDSKATSIELSFLPDVEVDDLALDSNKLITIKTEFQLINGKIKPITYYLCNDFLNEKYQNLWNKKEQELNEIISDLGEEPNKSGRGKKNVLRIEQIKTILRNNLAIEFEEIKKYMSKNVSGLKKIKPTTEFDWSKSLKKFDLNLEFEGENFDIPISHKGTGFKRLLMVAYFEYLASKKNVANQIFAIEEPETYLHPSAQEDLLNSIIRISKNSQFFLTTHSPVFAGATNGENSILVTKDDQGISHYQKGGADIIEKIINELGIKPDYNLLKNIKYLIFVEGRDDVYFLNAYAKTVLNKDLERDCILCVIGGGGSLKNYADLNLFTKLKGNNLYSVLVDGDDGKDGKDKWRERIKARCESDGADFKKLDKREIENYCHPNRIKECIISSIREKEGENSQNPKIEEIQSCEILINDDTDVEKHLKELGICSDFKSGLNVRVFTQMTKAEWEEMDSQAEIKNFIESIYSKIN
ncbi:hypothetical protein B5M47_03715 [candidate division CPR3 bacterium 4484_211]|uniref:Endonuclease GajA/Old nuclease/RecF-like AAA domain-containing protein n=1 Tax=candidate division CPR3 bacterium 4484_211 TaxID=1968527 RepID=A0A1W9NWP1_UNCC3|nr:MAG: hypothetical protein B5M47_03715 [candidate division CPR3 bacterium 4484_211]